MVAQTIVFIAGTVSTLVKDTSENAIAPRKPPYAITNWSTMSILSSLNLFARKVKANTPVKIVTPFYNMK